MRGRHLPAPATKSSRAPRCGLAPDFGSGHPQSPRSLMMKGTSEVRLAGLVVVRIAWITTIVVCGLVILIGLLTGTGGGDATRQLPGFAFSHDRDYSHQSSDFQSPELASLAPSAVLADAVRQKDRNRRATKSVPEESHYMPGVPTRTKSQPENTGGRTPVVTPRPKPPRTPGSDPPEPPQAPSVVPPKLPKPPPVISPEPSPAPPESPPGPSPAPPEPSPAPPVSPAP